MKIRKRINAYKITLGIFIILIAVFCILQAVGVFGSFASAFGEISIWKLLLAVCLLAIIIRCIFKLEIEGIFVPLGFIFMLFEKNIAYACGIDENIINNWLVLACSVLLSIGVGLIMPERRRKYKRITFHDGQVKSEKDGERIEVEAEVDDNGNTEDKNDDDDEYEEGDFATSNTRYFDGATFKKGYVMVNMSSTDVRFENPDKYEGGATLKLKCKMGNMDIYVPKGWRVAVDIENFMGNVDNSHRNDDLNAPLLTIVGQCRMGNIDIW